MRIVPIFAFFLLASILMFHSPSEFTANAAITTATVTDGDSRFIAGGAETSPRHVEFNNDGTKMFIVGGTLDFVYEWTLTTGFDISTATYAGNAEAFDIFKNNRNGFGDGQSRGIHFNTDGTKMFVVGNNFDEINEYSLSTGFDISSGGNSISAFTASEDISSTVGAFPQGIEFNTDGTKMFVTESTGSNQLHEFTLTTGFNLSTMVNDGTHVTSDVLGDTLLSPHGIAFSIDGTKMFVVSNDVNGISSNDSINEYTLTTGFDITTATFTATFDLSDRAHDPHGVEFNDDGTKMFIMDTKLPSQSGTGYLYEYILSCPWQLTGTCGEKQSDDPRNLNPYLTDEILVSVGPNKAIVTDTDYLPNIQIQKGDSIIITLNVADEGPVLDTNTFFGRSDIESVSLYTNFGPRPNGMNLYYANHFNSDGEVSKTFYEWNANRDNVVYDFTKSVEWDNPVVRTAQFDISTDNSSTPAEDKLTITFDSTWNELMPKSEIIVKVVDSKMGYSTTTLPFTLQVGEYDQSYEDVFGSNTNYRFVPLVSDTKVRESIEQWVDPFSGMTDERFVSSLGLHGDELPGYVKHLAQWVVEDKIDLADLIIAVEYIINVR